MAKATPTQIEALCKAAEAGELKKVKELLKKGISPNVKWKDKLDRTPLELAGGNGHEKVFFELVKAGANLHGKHSRYGGSLLSTLACSVMHLIILPAKPKNRIT